MAPLGACLGHGPADTSGHERSLPDTQVLLFTCRNDQCQPLPLDWFFPDTEEVTGSNPVAPTRHHPRSGRVFTPGLLYQESVSGSWGSKRAATASERRVDRALLGRMR
jgi:hypothetical protein